MLQLSFILIVCPTKIKNFFESYKSITVIHIFFLQGGEIFNTYGQLDNCNLLRSYGFNEDSPNPYDEVHNSTTTGTVLPVMFLNQLCYTA